MPPPRYRFGGYELEPESGELRRPDTTVVRLEPQPARALTLLLLARGELVARETLQRELWPEVHVEVDQGINYCIRQIRAALGDTADDPRFVETLPRRGYRFLVPVEVAPAPADETLRAPPRRSRTAALGVLATLVGVATVIALSAAREHRPRATLRLALFPLGLPGRTQLSVEAQATDDLLVALTRLGRGRVEVVGPLSTRPLVTADRPLHAAARQLGAHLVLDGGLRPDGDFFLQLLRTADGAHLWATRRSLSGAGSVEAIANEVLSVASQAGAAEATAGRTPDQ